jgi:hypothetical protein
MVKNASPSSGNGGNSSSGRPTILNFAFSQSISTLSFAKVVILTLDGSPESVVDGSSRTISTSFLAGIVIEPGFTISPLTTHFIPTSRSVAARCIWSPTVLTKTFDSYVSYHLHCYPEFFLIKYEFHD